MVTKKPTPAAQVAAMAKLIPVMREEHEKLGALIDEFEAIVGGGPTVGDKLREIESHWSDLWQGRYGEPYAWPNFAVSRGKWKVLFRKLPFEVLKVRVANYMKNGEEYFVTRRHPFDLFITTINQHVNPASAGGESGLSDTPTGCKHTPPCRDQFEHTKRRQQEATS